MKIKIEIKGMLPDDLRESTPLQINKFEEIALFLDCRTIQRIIKKYRERISQYKPVPYDKYEEWKKHGYLQDELSREERAYIYDLDNELDFVSNTPLPLSKEQLDEIDWKEKEREKWLDPFYTFSRALGNKLKSLKADKFLPVLIKAIICGEVRDEDFPDELVDRKGARKVIVTERQIYWLYKTKHPEKNINIGYGLAGKQFNKNLQSARSNIKSYINKLKKYNSSFSSLKKL